MTESEVYARAVEEAAFALAFWVGTTREDRLNWKPELPGSAGTRSVLEMIEECIQVNRRIAGALRGGTPEAAALELKSADEAKRELTASARELADSIRSLDEGALDRGYATHRGEMPGRMLAVMPTRNMHYHGGQVNLIQLLYGDTEFRVPTRPQS